MENSNDGELMARRSELVFGLVGPIGCPIHEAGTALEVSLKGVDYTTVPISLSSEMDNLLAAKGCAVPSEGKSILEGKIKKGNAVREAFGNDAVLAAEAIRQIVDFRKKHAESSSSVDPAKVDEEAALPLDEHAFIIHQLKREEEIDLLIKAFGKNFIQVSVVTPLSTRRASLVSKLGTEQPGWSNQLCEKHADDLVRMDQDEKSEVHGQRISKIFHLGDVFLSGETEASLKASSNRFVEALFGKNSISPTRDEFGSYAAKAASLRSVDLSRQVGAAITNTEGDIITIGCNEVPKYGGGNFWDDDPEDAKKRDIDQGGEANKSEVNKIVHDFIEVLRDQKLIGKKNTAKKILENEKHRKAIKKSLVSGITEYGRMVHAEMNALSDAARLGRSVKGATIYVTTYPCHNCAKHLVAAGIERIVFIEPYPKSKTESLFQDIVAADKEKSETVKIEHFFGISPRRYRDIFEKGSRQDDDGVIQAWYNGVQEPRLGNVAVGGTGREIQAIIENLYSTP